MHRIFIDEERCKGCQLCTVVCPKEILATSSRFNQQGYKVVEVMSQEECTACAACARICPDFAIRVFKKKKQEKAESIEEETA